jgi:hypothetical protein
MNCIDLSTTDYWNHAFVDQVIDDKELSYDQKIQCIVQELNKFLAFVQHPPSPSAGHFIWKCAGEDDYHPQYWLLSLKSCKDMFSRALERFPVRKPTRKRARCGEHMQQEKESSNEEDCSANNSKSNVSMRSAFEIWFRSPLRNQYDRLVFDPRPTYDASTSRHFNVYIAKRTTTMDMCKEYFDAGLDTNILDEYSKVILCNDDEKLWNFLLTMMITKLVQPWAQVHHTLTIVNPDWYIYSYWWKAYGRVAGGPHFAWTSWVWDKRMPPVSMLFDSLVLLLNKDESDKEMFAVALQTNRFTLLLRDISASKLEDCCHCSLFNIILGEQHADTLRGWKHLNKFDEMMEHENDGYMKAWLYKHWLRLLSSKKITVASQ